MGMIVSVYRDCSGLDCTNKGISARFSELCVVNVEGPFEPNERIPAVRLEQHVKGYLRLIPANDTGKNWFMFGGNYASTSDSRFREACERLTGHTHYGAVAIHDRVE